MQPRAERRRPRAPRTFWSLSVLGLLRERPMHPYELQRHLHERHTDEMLDLKRGSLYHAIEQLQRADFIEPVETSRAGRWPERTVYRITPAGAEELVSWVRDVTSLPGAVGLGVGDGAQAAEVAGFADGVIVGSAFVKRLLAAPDARAGLDSVRALAAELAAGVRGTAG